MIRKFAVALIATTMLVAPALAADAVKSTPAAPVAAATTTTVTPAVTPAPKDASKTATKTEQRKTIKVAHRRVHHLMIAKNHTPAIHVKTAKVLKPVKTVTLFPWTAPKTEHVKTEHHKSIKVAHRHVNHLMVAKNHTPASHVKTAKVTKPVKTVTLFPWTTPKTERVKTERVQTEHHKTIKVAHRHVNHLMVAKNHAPASHVKTAKVTKPAIKTVTATPVVSTATPVASKPAVKVIKADHVIKMVKVANRHGHHPIVAKNHKPASPVKTVNVSKPVKHADVLKMQGQVAHEVKSNKVIAN